MRSFASNIRKSILKQLTKLKSIKKDESNI
jgi:hypothetical protein